MAGLLERIGFGDKDCPWEYNRTSILVIHSHFCYAYCVINKIASIMEYWKVNMINYKKPEIKDKEWIEPLLKAVDAGSSHLNFTNIFAWSGIYNYQVAAVEDCLVVKGFTESIGTYYFYPAGRGKVTTVLDALQREARAVNYKLKLVGVTRENMEELTKLFPNKFSFMEDRAGFDYVYQLEKLVKLSGKKLQAKRNHINKFNSNYADWSFEEISGDNLAECWEMNQEWCLRNNCSHDDQLTSEYCAVRRCFENYESLELEGGLLRVEGRIIAFTMGERLNSDTYVTHVEKAFGEIQGAYQLINREFAKLIQQRYPDILYVNREEDMGYEGLRKAKLSYYPIKMVEKYLAEARD